jgi:hypothetical protein
MGSEAEDNGASKMKRKAYDGENIWWEVITAMLALGIMTFHFLV